MTTTLELAPGMFTTRKDVRASFGCGDRQGIEPCESHKKVFVYSDPKAGEEFGYTFDGRVEDDEYGPLYLYTGYGAIGHQKMESRNKTLRDHVKRGLEVHLFVADGTMPNSDAVRQRYIGPMMVDPIEPVVIRRGLGKDKKMRNALVFRFRPVPDTTPAWAPQDMPKAATQDSFENVELEDSVDDAPLAPNIPAQTGVKDKKSEQHTTAETIANILGGPKTVVRREGTLVEAFKKHLTAAGHAHKTFQITLAGEIGALTPDLYDITDHALYEAKGQATRNNVRMAIGQLADYRRHIPKQNSELRVVVLLPEAPSPDVKALLDSQNVHLVYQTDNGFAGFPLAD
ncbi:hypothetical protein [Streptomyces globisporus]|uniref:hypothetical protein n=1 Tax=Streptomyces globisporus TaxID=1908 RepID=UPI0037ACB6D3